MSDNPTGPPPQSQPGVPPPQPGYGAQPPQAAGTNGLAVASLILGLLWVCWLGSLLAVLFGHIALGQIKKTGGVQGGRGLAIAGLVLGYIGVATLILAIFFGDWSFSVG